MFSVIKVSESTFAGPCTDSIEVNDFDKSVEKAHRDLESAAGAEIQYDQRYVFAIWRAQAPQPDEGKRRPVEGWLLKNQTSTIVILNIFATAQSKDFVAIHTREGIFDRVIFGREFVCSKKMRYSELFSF